MVYSFGALIWESIQCISNIVEFYRVFKAGLQVWALVSRKSPLWQSFYRNPVLGIIDFCIAVVISSWSTYLAQSNHVLLFINARGYNYLTKKYEIMFLQKLILNLQVHLGVY